MVLFELAAAGSATGSAALGMFRYNRDGWMTDVQVNQNRRYQRQQVRLSQAEMFREDIRDLVGASVAKQNNFVLIATLILGMIGECYIEGPLPDGAAEFVASVYMLCVGSSLLYLVLSVICAITATTLASNCQKDLLTTLVRLPVNEFVAEIDDAASRESVEAFEHQSFKRIMRAPVWSRMKGLRPDPHDHQEMLAEEERKMRSEGDDISRSSRLSRGSWSSATRRSSSAPPERRPGGGLSSDHATPPSDTQSLRSDQSSLGPLGMAEPQEAKAERHLNVFHDKEKDWEVMGNCAFLFGALGASHLLQAYGYFSAARFYSGSNWASWVVQFIVVFVDAILAHASMTSNPFVGFIGFALNVAAPLSATFAMRAENPVWVDQVCVPLCFGCHSLWNLIGLVLLVQLLIHGEKSKSTQGANFTDATYPEAPESPSGLPPRKPSRRRFRRFDERRQRFFLVLLGNAVVIVAWLMTLAWAITEAVQGIGDDGMVINPRRSLSSMEVSAVVAAATASRWPAENTDRMKEDTQRATDFLDAIDVPVEWPHKRFRPHSIACGSLQTCFAANDFLVVEMTLDGPNVASTRILECPLPIGTSILDVTSHCPSPDGDQFDDNVEEVKNRYYYSSLQRRSHLSASRPVLKSPSCEPLLLLLLKTSGGGGGSSVARCSAGSGLMMLSLDTNDPIRRIASMRDDELGLLTLQGNRVLQHAASPVPPIAEAALSSPPNNSNTNDSSKDNNDSNILNSNNNNVPNNNSTISSKNNISKKEKKENLASISGWRSLWPILAAQEDRVASIDVATGEKDNVLLFSPLGLLDVVDPDSGSICQSFKWFTNPNEVVASAAIIPQTSSVLSVHQLGRSDGNLAASASSRLVRVELPRKFLEHPPTTPTTTPATVLPSFSRRMDGVGGVLEKSVRTIQQAMPMLRGSLVGEY